MVRLLLHRRVIKKLFLIMPLIVCADMAAMATFGQATRRMASIASSAVNILFPHDVMYWDWSKINLNDPDFLKNLSFPHTIKWGFADSAYQVEGPYGYDDKFFPNNWTEWEKGEGHIANGDKVGHACDRWNRYKDDIQLMKKCGAKVYRLSVEWSKIEPKINEFDELSMHHYKEVIAELLRNDITPVVCLFHHTVPLWFDEMGSWEHKRNIKYFVEYATYVFNELHEDVKSWMTLNEPVGFALGSYFVQDNLKHPPAKKDLRLCGRVVNNLLQAHCDCYQVFKEIDAESIIGISHVIQPIDPYHRFNIVERIGSSIFDYLVNDAAIDYFLTGKFNWGYPWKSLVTSYNEKAPYCLDKIWVNYYAHSNICMTWKKIFQPKEFIKPRPRADKNEIVTDNDQVIYPEGLYRAIQKCARLKIPMAIGECGLADNSDELKADFIKKHLYALSRAIQDGYPIDEVFWWTLMRNFEWAKGYTESFGLHHVNFETQERTLYPGAREFIEFMQSQARITDINAKN